MRKQLIWAVILLSTTTACKRGADLIEEQQQRAQNEQLMSERPNPCDFPDMTPLEAVAALRAEKTEISDEDIKLYSDRVMVRIMCSGQDVTGAKQKADDYADEMRNALQTTATE